MHARTTLRERGLARPALAGTFLPVAAVIVPLSILALVSWLSWRSVWADARSQILRAADSAAEYGTRTLESYSFAAGRVNDRLRGLSDSNIRENEKTLHEDLERIAAELPQSELIYVLDRDARVLVASNLYLAPHDLQLTGRADFRVLSSRSALSLYVSQTFISRLDGQLVFAVSRRRGNTGNSSSPDGFDGVVVVSVSPHVLANGLRRVLSAPNDRMALMRDDGYGISTTSGLTEPDQPLPKVDASSPFYVYAAQNVDSAVYLSGTAIPGKTALLAMRRIEGFPIYAVNLRSTADIVSTWWDVMAPQVAFGISATLGLLVLSLRVRRDQRTLAVSNAGLRINNELSSDRLSRAKRFGLVGTFEADLLTGVSRRSPEYMSVQGLPTAATEEHHDDWVRRLHPDDRVRAERELRRIIADSEGATEYAQTYRIITPSGEVRWIAARGEILRDQNGRAHTLLGAHVDVTPMRTAELAMAESDARLRLAQEAIGIGTWEWSHLARRLTLSPRMMGLLAFEPSDGPPDPGVALARVHPSDRWRVRRVLALAKSTGQLRCEFRIIRPNSDGKMETVWLVARGRLLSLNVNAGDRIIGVAYDVTDRKTAEAQAELLAHEVEHRAKNVLTIVAALVRMSAATNHEDFVKALQGRIVALARATTLLGNNRWEGANVHELIAHELAPFQVAADHDAQRITLTGPSIIVSAQAAQPLCMALHELVTNAAKYGALSVPEGWLDVRWWQAGIQFHLQWRERGGPRLNGPPTKTSFGSRLIAQVFTQQLNGTITRSWEAEGLSCLVSFPLK